MVEGMPYTAIDEIVIGADGHEYVIRAFTDQRHAGLIKGMLTDPASKSRDYQGNTLFANPEYPPVMVMWRADTSQRVAKMVDG